MSVPVDTCLHGDALEQLRTLPDECVQTCITSPPYWGLRDYGVSGQLGLESTPEEYVAKLVDVFREVRRVLRGDGTLWLNLGDSYASSPPGNTTKGVSAASTLQRVMSDRRRETLASGHATKRNTIAPGLKPKDLVGIPWRVAFALQSDGWYLRSDIIWAKPNPMPESVTDRPTRAHEYLFLLSKSARYYYDAEAIADAATHAGKKVSLGDKSLSRGQQNGQRVDLHHGNARAKSVTVAALRNRRTVWTVATQPYPDAHFAVFPPALIEPCVLAGAPVSGVVLDPFMGSGTTAQVAQNLGRRWIGVELSAEYIDLQMARTAQQAMPL